MNTNNALHIAKGVFGIAAQFGTARIIKDTLQHYSPAFTPLEKVGRFAAGIAITGLVQDKIRESADKQFDKNVVMVNDAVAKIKSNTEEPKS